MHTEGERFGSLTQAINALPSLNRYAHRTRSNAFTASQKIMNTGLGEALGEYKPHQPVDGYWKKE